MTERFTFAYRTPDDVREPNPDTAVAYIAMNAFLTSLKSPLAGRTLDEQRAQWSGKVLKQERTGKTSYVATILFTKK